MKEPPPLSLCDIGLNSIGADLRCVGPFLTRVPYKGAVYTMNMYVCTNAENNLLSRRASLTMELVQFDDRKLQTPQCMVT